MNAVVGLQPRLVPGTQAHSPVPRRLALLGTGNVGSAFVDRYQHLRARGIGLPPLAWLANSRGVQVCGEAPAQTLAQANAAPRRELPLQGWAEAEALHAGDIMVDATASERVADWHAEWLARGVHVVTANKLGHGSLLARSQAIVDAQRRTDARYGDSATVGAGLPLIRSIRDLVRGGDRIHRVEGVLSGSLAWLFNHYDGNRPFSGLVREAQRAGYTEPDPRIDLSGEDVRRKLLILARVSGRDLQAEDVRVASLVPSALAGLSIDEALASLEQLDPSIDERLLVARGNGTRLRFIGRFDASGASVGLQALAPDHPLSGGAGTDNKVAIFSDRYGVQPLVIQGPGAGADVTAAALLDDVLKLA